MQDLYACLATFVGSLLNPVVWIVVAVVLYLTRGWRSGLRVATSAVATVALEVVFDYGGNRSLWSERPLGLVSSAIIAIAISAAWVLVSKSATFEETFRDDGAGDD